MHSWGDTQEQHSPDPAIRQIWEGGTFGCVRKHDSDVNSWKNHQSRLVLDRRPLNGPHKQHSTHIFRLRKGLFFRPSRKVSLWSLVDSMTRDTGAEGRASRLYIHHRVKPSSVLPFTAPLFSSLDNPSPARCLCSSTQRCSTTTRIHPLHWIVLPWTAPAQASLHPGSSTFTRPLPSQLS